MFSAIRDALDGLAATIRALVVALAGAEGARLWLSGTRWQVAVGVGLGVIVVALLIDAAGRRWFLSKPLAKVRLMEWWTLVPMVMAAAAAAVSIIVTVSLTVPEGTPEATKQTIGAVATAITSFLSSAFVDKIGGEDDSKLSDRIRDNFYTTYENTFKDGSQGEFYVFSGSYGGATGWGRAARRVRAKGLSARWTADKAA
jgi:hypothetical protein